MKKEHNNINDQDLAAIRGAYHVFRTVESKLLANKDDSGDFTVNCIYMEDFFNKLETFNDTWGSESANLTNLGLIFKSFIAEHHYHVNDTFNLFTVLVELIENITRNKEQIIHAALYYNFINRNIDGFNSAGIENRDIIFKGI